MVGLLVSECQGGASDSESVIASRMQAAFDRTCGATEFDAAAIHGRALSVGSVFVQSASLAVYDLRPPYDGVQLTVFVDPKSCLITALDEADPEGVVTRLADDLAAVGGARVEPSPQFPGMVCRTYRLDRAVKSACVVDLQPHGAAPALVLTESLGTAAP